MSFSHRLHAQLLCSDACFLDLSEPLKKFIPNPYLQLLKKIYLFFFMYMCVCLIERVCTICVQVPEETRSGYKIPLELQTVVSCLVWVLGPRDGSMGDKLGSSRSSSRSASALKCVAIWLIDISILPFLKRSGLVLGGEWRWEEGMGGEERGKIWSGCENKQTKGGVEPSLHRLFTALTGDFSKVCFPELTLEVVTQHSAAQLEMGLQGARELPNPISCRVPWG